MESSREGEAQMAGEAPGILNGILQPRERGCELRPSGECAIPSKPASGTESQEDRHVSEVDEK